MYIYLNNVRLILLEELLNNNHHFVIIDDNSWVLDRPLPSLYCRLILCIWPFESGKYLSNSTSVFRKNISLHDIPGVIFGYGSIQDKKLDQCQMSHFLRLINFWLFMYSVFITPTLNQPWSIKSKSPYSFEHQKRSFPT